ncbi:MAG: alpha/beta hydrolase [Actinobacteria bacterium]|nr:alpha/beta hydrolase [Actinomycetota bacterium]
MQTVDVGDIRIAFEDTGSGDPLVLIMGYAGTRESWFPPFLEALGEDHRLITFDNRGTGGTTEGSAEFSVELFADDTAGLIDAIGLGRADVLGWSMGGYIAQELALRHPEKVGRIILASSYCGGAECIQIEPEVLKRIGDMSGSTREIIETQIGLFFSEKWIDENKDLVEEMAANPFEFPPEEIIYRQAVALGRWNGSCDRLETLKSRVLLLTGTDDVVIRPENSMIIANRLKGCWLVQLEGAGHGILIQYPEKCARIIGEFLLE